ncbi:MAG: hypothetical protein U0411_14450 [Thermodesulfovibrionales bacterium]
MMFTLVRRILCLVLIGALAFLIIALWTGGKEFRKLGRETGGAIRKGSERLAEKADRIKEKRDETTSAVKKWTGKKPPGDREGAPEEEGRTGRKKEAQGSGAEDEKASDADDAGSAEKGFFRTLLETAWGKIKEFVREKVSDDERPHKN